AGTPGPREAGEREHRQPRDRRAQRAHEGLARAGRCGIRLRDRRAHRGEEGARDPDPGLGPAGRDVRDRRRHEEHAPGRRPGAPRPLRLSAARARHVAVQRLLLGFALFLAILVAFAFLVLPVVAIFTHVGPGTLVDQLSNPVVHDAVIVTLKTTLVAQAAILLFGTPTAWFLATRRFPGRSVLVTLVELPFVLPPAVAGIGLLVAFGRVGLLGSTFEFLHIDIAFSWVAVVLAITLVA